MKSVVVLLLHLFVGCSFASNIGRFGFVDRVGGYGGGADRSAASNSDGRAYGGNVYGASDAGYSTSEEDGGARTEEYGTAGKAYSGADQRSAAAFDKNSHVGALSGYGRDNAHKSFGSYDYKYKAPEYHVESYFSDAKDSKQFGHDAHDQGYADREYAQRRDGGYGGYDGGYAAGAASGYGRRAVDAGHVVDYGGHGNGRNVAAVGGFDQGFNGYGETADYGTTAGIQPFYPYFAAGYPTY